MACPCSNNPATPSTCAQIANVDQWQSFLSKYQCVKTNNYYTQTSLSPSYINSQIALVQGAIADKMANPNSCNYVN